MREAEFNRFPCCGFGGDQNKQASKERRGTSQNGKSRYTFPPILRHTARYMHTSYWNDAGGVSGPGGIPVYPVVARLSPLPMRERVVMISGGLALGLMLVFCLIVEQWGGGERGDKMT